MEEGRMPGEYEWLEPRREHFRSREENVFL